MDIATLHSVIHSAETTKGTLDVALVSRDGGSFEVYRVEEIYLDEEHGLFNIVFDKNKKVQ